MASGRLIDYLGVGVIADRPTTPDLHPDTLGLWYATDTGTLSAWGGAVWEDVAGAGGTGTVTSVAASYDASIADILSMAGSPVTTTGTLTTSAVDPGADRLLFWDDSANKLTYLTLGTNLSITGTTINATGGGTGDVVGPASASADAIVLFDGTTGKLVKNGTLTVPQLRTESIIIACSDENTALTAGTAKVTFRMPYAFTLTAVRASLKTAQSAGSIFTVDINENGTTILSTKLTIDNTEKTSTTAATAPVISDSSLADDSEITVDIDQIGTSGATGLKIVLIGYPT